jgi:hypothetical protein
MCEVSAAKQRLERGQAGWHQTDRAAAVLQAAAGVPCAVWRHLPPLIVSSAAASCCKFCDCLPECVPLYAYRCSSSSAQSRALTGACSSSCICMSTLEPAELCCQLAQAEQQLKELGSL